MLIALSDVLFGVRFEMISAMASGEKCVEMLGIIEIESELDVACGWKTSIADAIAFAVALIV
jgi:hypothetical protein